ncbi:MAG: ABC transporter substrate-binding protein [Armatimonadota bacterium]|nr:ABC transporter substrate-binding protein [Armatimonadota bacterium]MDR7450615.1 ABC transporter substrate-binding protein [Armatimonadota bacterium]MDR7466252.1 ABC transporter substrate-binding protein [Armatimonadota bacterium]MDR7492973.1 ABC transporter substrate-binding protein [Armatimonadota bacterium]MDR7498270.1 ABC transporter substrate-binding protein [Armatimonadota bacterium]
MESKATVKRLTALTVIGIVLAVGLWAGPPAASQPRPIRIGFIAPTTGVFAANGRDMINGFLMFWEEHGNAVAGRRVEVIVEDDVGAPANTLTKARRLVEQDRVSMLVGPLTASSGLALRDFVDSNKIPTIFPIVSADDITQRRRTPYIVRVGWTSSQPNQPFGEWVAKNTSYRRIATIGYDFAFGHENVGGFQRTFEENGGRIVQKLWPPIGAPDYGPYLSQLRRDIDAVYAIFSGADALRFLSQYQEFGLKGRIPLIGGGTLTDEHVLPQMGNEALDVITALHYSAALSTPENRAFASAYSKKTQRSPSYYSENAYTGARFIFEALQAVRGNVEDAQAFLAALRRVTIADAPRGPVRLDAYANPVQNIYIRRVERRGGLLQNTVIFTYPNVSQFWKYDPEEFLRQPVYSRDYPPLRP